MNKNDPKIKKPSDEKEEKNLKRGLVEDDNEDIAYLNFQIIWPVAIISVTSLLFFGIGIGTMESVDHFTEQRFALDMVVTYGKSTVVCSDYYPRGKNYFPSILRQVEIKVLTNVFFRIAVCVPMAVRMFLAIVVRNQCRDDKHSTRPPKSKFYRFINEISVYAAIVEVLSQSMFAIVTIRFDHPEVYRWSFTVFVICSCIYMFARVVVMYKMPKEQMEKVDIISVLLKTVATLFYFWTISKFYFIHSAFIDKPPCHGYVPRYEAVTEYCAILAYLVFHLTLLIDIRDMRFICYPRTSSGECEPLKPNNFKTNGKFEFCRSFELRQRQVLGLEKGQDYEKPERF